MGLLIVRLVELLIVVVPVIGLVIGVLAFRSALKAHAAVLQLAAPLSLLTIPIFDTTAAILRRKLTGRSIYSTDRGHIHHCLLRRRAALRLLPGSRPACQVTCSEFWRHLLAMG